MQIKLRAVIILLVFSLTSFGWVGNIYGEINNDKLNNRVEQSNAALKRLFEAGDPNESQIRNMLSKRDIEGLEKLYDNIFRQYQSDASYESLLLDAYNLFSPANNISLSDLDYWVSKTESYIAFAARGGYKNELGWIARGSKMINATPKSRIDEMKELHREAAKDLQIAIKKNPLLMPAYYYLIAIAKASAMPFTPKEILYQAVKQDNRTYTIRLAYIHAIMPKWGGSYAEMSEFAKQTAQYANVNPLLWTLQGIVFAEQGTDYWRESKFVEATEAFTSALNYGDRTVWLKQRAGCLWQIGQKDRAVEDYKRILYYDPNNKEAKTMLQSLQRQMNH
jgi:tetratricopeptide (TPR) repeat protein